MSRIRGAGAGRYPKTKTVSVSLSQTLPFSVYRLAETCPLVRTKLEERIHIGS